MQIILTQAEIEEAIEAHVRNQIVIADTQKVGIELKAGRGADGFTATLDISAIAAATKPRQPAAAPVTKEVQPEPVAEEPEPKAKAETKPKAETKAEPKADSGSIFSGKGKAAEKTEETQPDEAPQEAGDETADSDAAAAANSEEPPKKAGAIFSFGK